MPIHLASENHKNVRPVRTMYAISVDSGQKQDSRFTLQVLR